MADITCPGCGKPTEQVANLAVCWTCKKGYIVSGGGVVEPGKEGDVGKGEVPIEYANLLRRHERLLERDPENIDLLFGKGLILSKMKRYEEALGIYDRIIGREPTHKKVWVAKAEVLAAMGRFDEAARHYQKALMATLGKDPRSEG